MFAAIASSCCEEINAGLPSEPSPSFRLFFTAGFGAAGFITTAAAGAGAGAGAEVLCEGADVGAASGAAAGAGIAADSSSVFDCGDFGVIAFLLAERAGESSSFATVIQPQMPS